MVHFANTGNGVKYTVLTTRVPVTAPIVRAMNTEATLFDGMNAFVPLVNE